ncbi:MAG TPA: O-antigen ligase family protein, partial [Candidatus Baltobacteraceae bacterium]|nr:O-antigen ligase family protein [Candidatus Baltobacteraceae bacterium]
AFCAGALFLVLALDRRRGAVVALALAVALAVAFGSAFAHHDPALGFVRVRSWIAGWRVFTLFPFSGSGPMTFYEIYPAVQPLGGDPPGAFGALHPHNLVLSLLADLGIVGLGAVVLGWARIGRAIRGSLRGAPPARLRFGYAVCAGLIASVTQGAVDIVGVVALSFVWIPYAALALVAAAEGPP